MAIDTENYSFFSQDHVLAIFCCYCCCCLLLLILPILSHLRSLCISLRRHGNVSDPILCLIEAINKAFSYCKMSPFLSNYQNTTVRKGHVLS